MARSKKPAPKAAGKTKTKTPPRWAPSLVGDLLKSIAFANGVRYGEGDGVEYLLEVDTRSGPWGPAWELAIENMGNGVYHMTLARART